MNKTTLRKTILTGMGLFLFTCIQAEATSTDSKIVIDGRVDNLSQNYNDDATSPAGTRPTNSTFRIQSLRVDFTGKIGEETAYRVRMSPPNLPNTAATTSVVGYPFAADNLSNFLDYAYIQRTLSEGLLLTVGKQWSGAAGWVGYYDLSDVYMYPKAFLETIGNGMIYTTGVGLRYDFAGQKVLFSVTDPGAGSTDTGTAAGNANNARQAVGGRWLGKFMDGVLNPTLSYLSEGRQNQTASTKGLTNTYMSAGVKYTIPVIDVDADYIANSYADKTTAGQTDTTTSIMLLARYKMDDKGLKAFLGYENSNQTTNTSATVSKVVKTSAYQLGVEYYPKKDEDFRYHVVYTVANGNTDLGTGAASTNQAQNQIIAGIRFKSDLLK